MDIHQMHLMLLPGMDGTGRLFEPLAKALAPTIKPVAVSYPTDQPLGYNELLALIETFVPSGPFVVVGESFSGPLALMLAARRPPNLKGVVLCASFVKFPLPVPKRWRSVVRPWMFRFQPLWLLCFVLLGRHGFGTLGHMLRSAVRTVSPVAFAARALSVANVDVSQELQACSVPVLYLRATSDMVIHSNCSKLIQSLRPDVDVATLPGPHLVLQVSPERAADILQGFCMRVNTANDRDGGNECESRS